MSGPTGIVPAGALGSTDLSTPRQTPNIQPAAPAGPVSTQQSSWPSWYQQPVGTPVNGGTFYYGGTVGTFFDDNVFATNSNRLSDWAFFERPELAWYKQGPNYTISTDAFIEGREYARFTSENQVNGSIGTNFTMMPDNNTQLVGALRYIHGHLDRGSSETVVTVGGMPTLISTLFNSPVAYDEGLGSIALNKRYGDWWSSLGAAGLAVQYMNPIIGGGSPLAGTGVDLSYADGDIGSANGRLGRVIAPLTSVFIEAAGNTRDWHVNYFDSNGYRVDAGILFEQGPGARLKGEIWGGYMNQQYTGATMQPISTWTYGVSLAALLADNLTAVVEGKREAKEAALGLAALPSGLLGVSISTCQTIGSGAVCVSNIETSIGGRLDYRILPRVVIGAGVTYLEDDYQGVLAFGRVDRTLSPLASLKYFATPNLTFAFDFRNVAFSSGGGMAAAPFTSVNALSYYKDIYMLSMNAKF
jgi:hypothetical protein